MARSALRDQYFLELGELTGRVLASFGATASSGPMGTEETVRKLERWLESNAVAVERCQRTFGEIEEATEQDLAHASVAVRALTQLRRST